MNLMSLKKLWKIAMETPEKNLNNHSDFMSDKIKNDKAQELSASIDELQLSGTLKPLLYGVYLLKNDMIESDFIIALIKKHFHRTNSQAAKILEEITKNGKALCETYPRDVAETKIIQVIEYSESYNKDIKCIMQKSESNVIKKP